MIRAGTDEYREAARQLKAVDQPLRKALRAELREIAKPAGDRAIEHLADAMPQRGGLAELIRQRGRVSIQSSSAAVRIVLDNRRVQVSAYEGGLFRRPTFGRQPWVVQAVPAGKAWESMQVDAPRMADRVLDATTRAVARGIGAT